jgi:transposase
MTMEHIAAVDLHSDNGYYGIIEPDGKRVYQKRLPNDLSSVLHELEPYRETIRCIVIESTYNWYWLGDGLREQGYRVKLANPAKFEKYNDLKYTDDKTDTFFLTEMERLNILPTGHIYPREERGLRDLLRRRMLFVQQKTSHILSFQSLISRQTGGSITSNDIKKLETEDVEKLLEGQERHVVFAGQSTIAVIGFLQERIRLLEKMVLASARLRTEYEKLQSIPGIGKILALVIMYETGAIGRFKAAGNYVSYCRCVKSNHLSNGKKKGSGNRKNGNKYLSWAYVEAANYSRRYCEEAKKYYQRKLAKGNSAIATKALAAKLCRAAYFIMRDQVEFDVTRMFG